MQVVGGVDQYGQIDEQYLVILVVEIVYQCMQFGNEVGVVWQVDCCKQCKCCEKGKVWCFVEQ